MPEWIEPLITSILVIVGWSIINYQNNCREIRRDKRSVIDSLIEQIDQLTREAIQFHTNEQFTPEHASEIKQKISRVCKISHRYELTDDQFKSQVKYRKSITWSNFDSATSFTQQEQQSLIIKNIIDAGEELIDAIEDKYCNEYHHATQTPWWKFWQAKKFRG